METVKKIVTVRFPAPLPAAITCPICEGNKCNVCNWSAQINIEVDAKVPIQRDLIVQYVAENIEDIAMDLTKQYGLVPDVEPVDMFDVDGKQYEIVRVSSLGGVVWIANRLDEFESPRYFKSMKAYLQFKSGLDD